MWWMDFGGNLLITVLRKDSVSIELFVEMILVLFCHEDKSHSLSFLVN